MSPANAPDRPPLRRHEHEIRVRYRECDPMSLAHHSAYAEWFERGRTELLRADGVAYRDLETQGVFVAVTSLSITYKLAARYDDLLTLRTDLVDISHVKILHQYALYRGPLLLAVGKTTLACLDRQGRVRRLPDLLLDHAHGRLTAPS